jgi:hypothetical protein
MLRAAGTNSCSSSTCFGPISTFNEVTPVMLPPGRPRLATSGALWLQGHACHVAAGWAFIPDQPRFACEGAILTAMGSRKEERKKSLSVRFQVEALRPIVLD